MSEEQPPHPPEYTITIRITTPDGITMGINETVLVSFLRLVGDGRNSEFRRIVTENLERLIDRLPPEAR